MCNCRTRHSNSWSDKIWGYLHWASDDEIYTVPAQFFSGDLMPISLTCYPWNCLCYISTKELWASDYFLLPLKPKPDLMLFIPPHPLSCSLYLPFTKLVSVSIPLLDTLMLYALHFIQDIQHYLHTTWRLCIFVPLYWCFPFVYFYSLFFSLCTGLYIPVILTWPHVSVPINQIEHFLPFINKVA